MRAIRFLFLLLLPVISNAHPGGGMIALDSNTVVFGDPANNVLWRMENGKKPDALFTKFHVHWTTLGLDGNIYAESFGEMGGALFRIDLGGLKHIKVAEETDLNVHVFAVGKNGEFIFQKHGQIVHRSRDGRNTPFRGHGRPAKDEAPLGQVIAYQWAGDTLYLSDGGNLRRIGNDGVVRFVAKVEGKLLEHKIWNSIDSPRIWSIAIDSRKRIYTALPDIGQVVRIEPDGSQHVIDRYPGEWRVTAVATFGDNVFLLESSDRRNVGQRVRVIRGSSPAELFGQIDQ